MHLGQLVRLPGQQFSIAQAGQLASREGALRDTRVDGVTDFGRPRVVIQQAFESGKMVLDTIGALVQR